MFGSEVICEHILCLTEINIELLVATLWHKQACMLGTILKTRETECFFFFFLKCTVCQPNIYSTQMLQPSSFISQSNDGTVFQTSIMTPRRKKNRGMRERRLEDVVERMTKTGKMVGGTGEIKGAETDSERRGF